MRARAMTSQSAPHSLSINDVASRKLVPYPASMFKSKDQMHEAKSKAYLKNILKVDVSNIHAERDLETIFLDGCSVLWVIPRPISGRVQDYLGRFCGHIHEFLKKTYVLHLTDINQTIQRQVQGMGKTREQARCKHCNAP